jgi:HK97 family phage prohead protease
MFETRTLQSKVEDRAGGETNSPVIAGYAAVFDSPAEIYGMFLEKIARGAFRASIARDDVRGVFNHDNNLILGRNTAKTLRLSEDSKGLAYEIDPPATSYAQDLLVSIERGDISQSSFRFRATREEWDETGDMPVRTILECELIDVSPVTYPAYEDALVGLRASAAQTLAEARNSGRLKAPPAPAPAASLAPNAQLRMRAGLDLRARTTSRL